MLPNIFKGARKRDNKYKDLATPQNDRINTLNKLDEDSLTDIKHKKYLIESSKNSVEELNPEYMREMADKEQRYKANKKFYKEEKEKADSKIKYVNKIIGENPEIPIEEINILNKLKEFNNLRNEYFTNQFNNELEKDKFINIRSIDKSIYELEDKLRKKEGKGVFTYQDKFVKLLILLTQLFTNNSSKELINDIEQLINNLYDNKQITKQVYNNLNKAISYVQSTNIYDIYKNDW